MNADGSDQNVFTVDTYVRGRPAWQPGAQARPEAPKRGSRFAEKQMVAILRESIYRCLRFARGLVSSADLGGEDAFKLSL